MIGPKPKNQLFIITAEAFMAASADEIDATVAALKEAGLYSLPFPEVDIRVAGDCIGRYKIDDIAKDPGRYRDFLNMKKQGLVLQVNDEYCISNIGNGHWIDFKGVSLDHINYEKHFVIDRSNVNLPPQDHTVTDKAKYGGDYGASEIERDAVAAILIALLATRNARKNVDHHGRATRSLSSAKKPGSTKGYEYVTTISVPQQHEMEDDPDKPAVEGKSKAPHLRRAHLRRQHHGPKNVLIKTVLIAPVFVNADREWVSQRKAYNVSL